MGPTQGPEAVPGLQRAGRLSFISPALVNTSHVWPWGKGIMDFGAVSAAAVKVPLLPSDYSRKAHVCAQLHCSPFGSDVTGITEGNTPHQQPGKSLPKEPTEQVQALLPQNICSLGAQSTGPAWK